MPLLPRAARMRVLFLAGILAILFLALIVRLFRLQILQHSHISTLARENHVQVEVVVPPRGRIYSVDGVLLAGNLPRRDLMVRTAYLSAAAEQELTTVLASVLPQLDVAATLRRHRAGPAPEIEPLVLWRGLNDEQLSRVLVVRHNLPGVDVVTNRRRFYPLGAAGMHLLGYLSGVDTAVLEVSGQRDLYRAIGQIGRTGIERQYENWMRGEPGSRHVEVDALGRTLGILSTQAALPGNDLHLSVDASLQLDAWHAMEGRRGAVVIIEVSSGRIRAMVSSPAHDPNHFVVGISDRDFAQLRRQQGNLFNRALAGQYPPGSTIKPFFALAGLYHEAAVAHDELWCNGHFILPGSRHVYNDWKAHGRVGLHASIEQSCDVFYYRLALELGVERSGDFLRAFGFGRVHGTGFPEEKPGLVPGDQWKRRQVGERWYAGDTVSYGIGQGYLLVTPMQLALATARLATAGRQVRPVLVEGRDGPVSQPGWIDLPQGLPAAGDWQLIHDGMQAVVHGQQGTARAQARHIDFTIAGKTGTAQVVQLRQRDKDAEVPEQEQDHSLFIGYGPIAAAGKGPAPLAIAVVVENAGSGSTVAAPIAVQLLREYMRRRPAWSGS